MNDLSAEFTQVRNADEVESIRNKVDIPDISQFPIPTIDRHQLERLGQMTLMIVKPSPDRGFEEIPEGGVMIDYGCGDGGLGAVIASERRCHLVQADLRDNRVQPYRNGPFVALPTDVPPEFSHPVAEAIFLNDVLQHVRPYEGMSPDDTKLAFLRGLLTGLKPEGRIIITSASDSADHLRKNDYLEEMVGRDDQLRGKVIIRL